MIYTKTKWFPLNPQANKVTIGIWLYDTAATTEKKEKKKKRKIHTIDQFES